MLNTSSTGERDASPIRAMPPLGGRRPGSAAYRSGVPLFDSPPYGQISSIIRATIIPLVFLKMTDLGKLLLVLGSVIFLVGAALLLAGRFNLPLGRLPGDIVYRGKNSVFYFPLTTCIVISVVLSLLFWLFGRGHR